MRFWDQMQDRYGFADGEATPDGVEVYRAVYVRAVNRLADQLGSQCRVVAFDRPGDHNGYLVLSHRLADLEQAGIQPEAYTEDVDIRVPQASDALLEQAIEIAHDLDLDGFVRVQVDVDPDFDDFLSTLQP
jgi:hypothetical protein